MRSTRTGFDYDDPALLQKYFMGYGFRDRLPPWLGGPSMLERSMTPMLKAIKQAAQAYLESPPTIAQLSFPVLVSHEYIDTASAALRSLSIKMNCCVASGATYAARAYGTGRLDCSNEPGAPLDPVYLVLSVDYTGAALTAHILTEDCNVFGEPRTVQSTTLGADSNDLSRPEGRAELAATLRNITTLPLKDWEGEDGKYLEYVLFTGEFGNDARLHDVVRDVLREKFEGRVAVKDSVHRNIDPLFAASRGAAEANWDRLADASSRPRNIAGLTMPYQGL